MNKFIYLVCFVLSMPLCDAQQLPKLSELGLIEVESVSIELPTKSREYGYFELSYENGSAVSGLLDWSNGWGESLKITLASKPLRLTYSKETNSGMSYEKATFKDFQMNSDGTVKQYTIDCSSYSSRYGKENYTFPVKLQYDNEQHLIKVESKFCDVENEWRDGNLYRQIATRKYDNDPYSMVSVFIYGADLNPGLEIISSEEGFTMDIPLGTLGIFGRQSKNLPQQMQYKYSDSQRTYGCYFYYEYDDQNRLVRKDDSDKNTVYFKYGSTTNLNSLIPQSTKFIDHIFGLDGTKGSLSKGIKIMQKTDGKSNIVNVR